MLPHLRMQEIVSIKLRASPWKMKLSSRISHVGGSCWISAVQHKPYDSRALLRGRTALSTPPFLWLFLINSKRIVCYPRIVIILTSVQHTHTNTHTTNKGSFPISCREQIKEILKTSWLNKCLLKRRWRPTFSATIKWQQQKKKKKNPVQIVPD